MEEKRKKKRKVRRTQSLHSW